MKRKLVLCTFILTTFLLVGCSRGNADNVSPSSVPESATPSPSAELSQTTDQIQQHTVQNSSEEKTMISAEDAREIALAQVPGATAADLREFRSDYDNGRLQYEGTIYYEQNEYEFEIDGTSGDILEWDVEPIYDGSF